MVKFFSVFSVANISTFAAIAGEHVLLLLFVSIKMYYISKRNDLSALHKQIIQLQYELLQYRYHALTKPLYLGSSFESNINLSKVTSFFFCVSNSQLEIIALEKVTTVFTQLKTNITETCKWGHS